MPDPAAPNGRPALIDALRAELLRVREQAGISQRAVTRATQHPDNSRPINELELGKSYRATMIGLQAHIDAYVLAAQAAGHDVTAGEIWRAALQEWEAQLRQPLALGGAREDDARAAMNGHSSPKKRSRRHVPKPRR